MHECPICGQICDCDGDDFFHDKSPQYCACDCVEQAEREAQRFREVLERFNGQWFSDSAAERLFCTGLEKAARKTGGVFQACLRRLFKPVKTNLKEKQ